MANEWNIHNKMNDAKKPPTKRKEKKQQAWPTTKEPLSLQFLFSSFTVDRTSGWNMPRRVECDSLRPVTTLDKIGWRRIGLLPFFFRFCGPSKFFNSSRGSRFLDPDHSELLRSRSMVATSQDKKKTRIYWRRWLCRRVNWMVAGRGVCKIAVTPWRKLRCRGLALHSTHLVLSCWCRQSKIDLCAITRWDGTRPKWVVLPLLHNRNCIRDRSTSNLRQGLNSMVSKYLTCNDYFRQQWKNAILS